MMHLCIMLYTNWTPLRGSEQAEWQFGRELEAGWTSGYMGKNSGTVLSGSPINEMRSQRQMMLGDCQRWWRNRRFAEFRRKIILETWCSVGYGSIGELETVVTGGWGRDFKSVNAPANRIWALEIQPEFTVNHPLDNPFDSLQCSWIIWCPALGFWVAL